MNKSPIPPYFKRLIMKKYYDSRMIGGGADIGSDVNVLKLEVFIFSENNLSENDIVVKIMEALSDDEKQILISPIGDNRENNVSLENFYCDMGNAGEDFIGGDHPLEKYVDREKLFKWITSNYSLKVKPINENTINSINKGTDNTI